MPKRHKNLFFSLSKEEFESGIEAIKSEIEVLSYFEIVIRLQQLIAKVGDTHTSVKYFDNNKILPLSFYWFKDGIYIDGRTPAYSDLIGKKIIKVNGFEISEIADSLATLVTIDNKACTKNSVPKRLDFINFMNISIS